MKSEKVFLNEKSELGLFVSRNKCRAYRGIFDLRETNLVYLKKSYLLLKTAQLRCAGGVLSLI